MSYTLTRRGRNGIEAWTITVIHTSYPGKAVETDMVGTQAEADAQATTIDTNVSAQPTTYFGT